MDRHEGPENDALQRRPRAQGGAEDTGTVPGGEAAGPREREQRQVHAHDRDDVPGEDVQQHGHFL